MDALHLVERAGGTGTRVRQRMVRGARGGRGRLVDPDGGVEERLRVLLGASDVARAERRGGHDVDDA